MPCAAALLLRKMQKGCPHTLSAAGEAQAEGQEAADATRRSAGSGSQQRCLTEVTPPAVHRGAYSNASSSLLPCIDPSRYHTHVVQLAARCNHRNVNPAH